MKLSNAWQLLKGNLKEMWPKKIVALVIVAALIVTLFGLTFEKGPTQNISVDVVNLDSTTGNSSAAASVIAVMKQGTTVNIITLRGSSDPNALQEALDDMEAGKVEAVFVFGNNFTSDIVTWIASARNGTTSPPSNLMVYLDSSNPIAAGAIQAEVQRTVQVVLAMKYHLSQPVKVIATVVYGSGVDMRDFMAPAIAGLLIFILTLMPTLMSSMMDGGNASSRNESSLGETLLAQSLTSLCIGMVLATTILLVLLSFQVTMAGDLTAAFAILSLLALASAGLGQLLAAASNRAPGATIVVFPMVLYAAILLGGLILPISAVPDYLLPISYLFPLTYAIDGTRLAMLSGMGWDVCWMQVTSLIIYAAACTTLVWWMGRRFAR